MTRKWRKNSNMKVKDQNKEKQLENTAQKEKFKSLISSERRRDTAFMKNKIH